MDPVIPRILDANFNRAREATRVMEDYARFCLDDRRLAEQAKSLRHALADTYHQHDLAGPIRSRDIVGDVGREVAGAGEYDRASPAQVAVAAGKRLSEALRAIEEFGKTASAAFARAVEATRYDGYELERRIAIRAHARARFGKVRLYVLITEAHCGGPWLETAAAAIEGGADCLQLREKDLPDGELTARARKLTELCHQGDALCIINDRPDIALLAGADGVHVGQEELSVPDVRRVVGPDLLIGLSTHSPEQVEQGADLSPDYLAVGPMFATPTKPQEHIAGPQTLRAAVEMTGLPLVAIGGITAQNAPQVREVGGRCICACAAVIAQPDPAAAARALRRAVAD